MCFECVNVDVARFRYKKTRQKEHRYMLSSNGCIIPTGLSALFREIEIAKYLVFQDGQVGEGGQWRVW